MRGHSRRKHQEIQYNPKRLSTVNTYCSEYSNHLGLCSLHLSEIVPQQHLSSAIVNFLAEMEVLNAETLELAFTINKQDLTNGVWKVISKLKPLWLEDKIEYKVVT